MPGTRGGLPPAPPLATVPPLEETGQAGIHLDQPDAHNPQDPDTAAAPAAAGLDPPAGGAGPLPQAALPAAAGWQPTGAQPPATILTITGAGTPAGTGQRPDWDVFQPPDQVYLDRLRSPSSDYERFLRINEAVFPVPHLDGLYEVMTGVGATDATVLGQGPSTPVRFNVDLAPDGHFRLLDLYSHPVTDPSALDSLTQLDAAILDYAVRAEDALLRLTDSPAGPVVWSDRTGLELVHGPLVDGDGTLVWVRGPVPHSYSAPGHVVAGAQYELRNPGLRADGTLPYQPQGVHYKAWGSDTCAVLACGMVLHDYGQPAVRADLIAQATALASGPAWEGLTDEQMVALLTQRGLPASIRTNFTGSGEELAALAANGSVILGVTVRDRDGNRYGHAVVMGEPQQIGPYTMLGIRDPTGSTYYVRADQLVRQNPPPGYELAVIVPGVSGSGQETEFRLLPDQLPTLPGFTLTPPDARTQLPTSPIGISPDLWSLLHPQPKIATDAPGWQQLSTPLRDPLLERLLTDHTPPQGAWTPDLGLLQVSDVGVQTTTVASPAPYLGGNPVADTLGPYALPAMGAVGAIGTAVGLYLLSRGPAIASCAPQASSAGPPPIAALVLTACTLSR